MWKYLLLPALILLVTGCSGSGGKSGSTVEALDGSTVSSWTKTTVANIGGGGMLSQHLKAVPGADGDMHFFYFQGESADSFALTHLVADDTTFVSLDEQMAAVTDNCLTLGVSATPANGFVAAYQGGTIRECGSEQQSDAMVSVFQNHAWSEYTAGIGYVARNPVFQDGLAGKNMAVAVDGKGDIHVCYQFFYEGCDAMNFNFPDLLYTRLSGADPLGAHGEQVVTGNVYNANGTASEQNRVGDQVAMVVDGNDRPIIVYDADLSPVMPDKKQKGLRVSAYTDDGFVHQWIDTGIEVAHLSAAMDHEGNPAVAYYVASPYEDDRGTHDHCLKFAFRKDGVWTVTMVAENVKAGADCALAFDRESRPWIAFHAEENHSGSVSLKDLYIAVLMDDGWTVETVSETGDTGHFNSLWFDKDNNPRIATFRKDTGTVDLFAWNEGEEE